MALVQGQAASHTELLQAQLAFEQKSILIGRIFHGCSPLRATEASLQCRRYYLAPLTRSKKGIRGSWHS